ncbi:hypothetical protein DFJ73DRAFT_773036 [Zopfochytrium polystomum]|nr:hypothetical protein DFJ73DRAFT_773036 [Zopfochytrium polystomum]
MRPLVLGSSTPTNWREDGTPITGVNPAATSTTTPGLVGADSYETAIPTGLVLAAFAIMVAATAVGIYSLKANEAPWNEPPPYQLPAAELDAEANAAAAASDVGPFPVKTSGGGWWSQKKNKSRAASAQPATKTNLFWIIQNPRWLPLFFASVLLDLYVYFSLVEFVANSTWNRPFGYSPQYFLLAGCFALFQARAYTKFFTTKPTNKAAISDSGYSVRTRVNILLFVLVLCLAIKKATLTGNTSFTGVRSVIQFNGTFNYAEYTDTYHIAPGYVYNRVYTTYSSNGEEDIFAGPLWACLPYDTPLVANSTFNATSTTTLICQIRQPGFSTFLDWWVWIKVVGVAISLWKLVAGHDDAASYLKFNAPMLVIAFVEAVAVFFRSVASPGIYLELAWCPNTDFHYCQIMELGVLYPYSLRQTALWASNLGVYPVDKIAGYGQISS